MVFIDFSKAFDSVNRRTMLHILSMYGIPEKIIAAVLPIKQIVSWTLFLLKVTRKEILSSNSFRETKDVRFLMFLVRLWVGASSPC